MYANNEGGFVITDAENSDFFFEKSKETNELIYEGCCVEPKNIKEVISDLKNYDNGKGNEI